MEETLAAKDKVVAAKDNEIERLRLAEGGHAMALQEAGEKLVSKANELAAQDGELARLRLDDEQQRKVLQEAGEKLILKDTYLAARETELARFHVAEGEQGRALRDMEKTLSLTEQALARKDSAIQSLVLVNTRVRQEMGEKLVAKDKEIERLRRRAYPGVEVIDVDEGVTRMQEAPDAKDLKESPAKRQRAAEDASTRCLAELGGRLIQVKQVPARVP